MQYSRAESAVRSVLRCHKLCENRPRRRVFRSSLAELQMEKDSMAEGGGIRTHERLSPLPVFKFDTGLSCIVHFICWQRFLQFARSPMSIPIVFRPSPWWSAWWSAIVKLRARSRLDGGLSPRLVNRPVLFCRERECHPHWARHRGKVNPDSRRLLRDCGRLPERIAALALGALRATEQSEPQVAVQCPA
jgi:hypothetical protein